MAKLKYKQNNQWVEFPVSASKISIASAVVTLSQNSFTYDGTSKVPNVSSVVLNGTTLEYGVDYAVISTNATNAGTYSIDVVGINNYDGNASASWVINKAQATISGDDSISLSEGDTVTETYTTTGDGTMSFSISDSTIATISSSENSVTITSVAAGTAILTVTVAEGTNYLGATKTVGVEVTQASTTTVFGVIWDYSLSSPQLTRLTPQTDPLGVVTNVPAREPTACVGNDGNGQSDFDNYMPWAGMQRYNYVNGQVVDFVDYSNGETFVYIPEFWSKIVDDSVNGKMYFYISSAELEGFTKHIGSGRYVARYQCDANFMSMPNGTPKISTSLGDFRTGITSIDTNHFQFDIHTYMARNLLYLVECANFNSQAKIGAGITSGTVQVMGQTDILVYHTGRIDREGDNISAIQYRWMENIFGNIWEWIDGVLSNNNNIFICYNSNQYSNSITSEYIDSGIALPASDGSFIKTGQEYDNCYFSPKTVGASDSTYLCDKLFTASDLRGIRIGGSYANGTGAGLFRWDVNDLPTRVDSTFGSRSILILGGDS